ncbi:MULTISPECIES: hypothetical protein [Paenibacillus]|uniref:SMI1/KNR4 family protein n=1 Tax=Paenibacillus cucumis (ex Kampfer et al. 2016) TaxID=1776858 RepID=A0ABS7KPB9_9BACL|nr:hypothetical protein [Paenibacillus cucumis (ex Kampfer et al. 2016)]MBY0205816.1 SMI1/KNR4 family protein [Paenibacillus cucumis (ex Kampfer et al. 2016)]
MQSLNAALTRFVEQQDLYNETYGLFQNHDLRPRVLPVQPEVDKRISLSPELEYLYSHYEMVDAQAEGTLKMKSAAVEIGDAALLFFVAPEHLHRQQLGFRWVGMQEPYKESDSWSPNHIVIANVNDDPIIVDVEASHSPVYAAFEGGEPKRVADSLADFFTALAILIESACSFSGEVKDEETYETKPEYLVQVQPKLRELLGEVHTKHLIEYLSL